MRKPGTGPDPEAVSDSPSGRTHTGKQVKTNRRDAVADMIAAYGKAAGAATRLGFDSVEIHAHGYLVDEFFWGVRIPARINMARPVDQAQFAGDVIRACRAQMPNDMPLILRWSQWKQQDYSARLAESPKEMEAFLGCLSMRGCVARQSAALVGRRIP